ncbi:hypothetical protein F4813DRAFT_398672 [Daldinia decipiens]|uniref:uncharacterized protein n=1 Tax=Daldinia decipiens TaxID=326647 RepID=UPI0020C30A33|nr:uncharacterized protein F4813DRAFT_398672 [Daldinia decipiens]KAI1655127.1 hypothetical protein F4813DRAFT_398672 [Daldinia decipiens]
MADTIRGDGLLMAHDALAELIEDPQRLDRARNRFSNSPPTGNIWKWKHEIPLKIESESESESETDSEAQGDVLLSRSARTIGGVKRRRPKSDEELRLIANRRLMRERGREASRPFHQFIYQISKEREIIQSKLGPEESISSGLTDINTKAYENVQSTWIKRGIWNRKWGILPGMLWKHEQPLDEMLVEEMGPDPAGQANPLEDDGRRVEARSPPRQVFEPFPPVESNSSLASGFPAASQREMPAVPNPDGLQTSSANHSPSAPNSQRRLREGRQDARSATGQRPRPGQRMPSPEDGWVRPTAGTVLGLVHPTKVSKAPRKELGPQRRKNASKLRPNAPVVPASKPAPVPPRRSRRLQEAKYKASTNPAVVASTDLGNGTSLPRPKKTTISPKSSSLAKPRGVPNRPGTRHPRSKWDGALSLYKGYCFPNFSGLHFILSHAGVSI